MEILKQRVEQEISEKERMRTEIDEWKRTTEINSNPGSAFAGLYMIDKLALKVQDFLTGTVQDSQSDMKLAAHLKNIPDSKLDLKSQSLWSQEISKLSEQYKAEYI